MSDDNSPSVCGIKKLKGSSDYAIWKFATRNYLESKDWYKAVEFEGTELPATLKDTDRKARTTLCLLIEPECYAHVFNATTAKEVWQSLKTAYEDKGWGRRIALQRELWDCRLVNFPNMEKYITKVIFLTQQLADIDAKVDDDWITSILLSGLTEVYNPLIMAVDNSGTKVSLEQIKTKLLQEGNRQATSNDDKELAAFKASKVYKNKPNSAKPDRKSKCYKCHKWHKPSEECTKSTKHVAVFSKLSLPNVLHAPDLSMNLISISNLLKQEYSVHFHRKGSYIENGDDQKVANLKEIDGIFELVENDNCIAHLTLSNELTNLWHRRLAHLGQNYINMLTKMVTGININKTDKTEPCVPFIQGPKLKLLLKKLPIKRAIFEEEG
ncbi:gag-polypeptide of LTR copia-type domain-containing protein [Phthorimaea operculella]|nr:gag-polypeptide of LTR copia-type domain-containing protein [Phthorimaea operculella]